MKIAVSTAVLASLVAPAFSLSYLESLTGTAPLAPAGAGMASYLDALPTNGASAPTGAGLSSYADALGGGAVAAPAAPAAPVAAAPAIAAPAGKDYLDAIGAAVSNGAPTGAGITGYLDALPQTPSVSGAGLIAYKDALPVTNTVSGTGAGFDTYTDVLSGGKAAGIGKSFSPFGSSKGAAFVGGASSGGLTFTLEAADVNSLVEQLQGSSGSIRLTGTIDSVQVF